MNVSFTKYHGTGNDFILIDDRQLHFSPDPSEIHRLCDRHFGIGADGLILLRIKEGFDFEMVYYNSDGGLSSMCGNGGRCISAFAKSCGINKNEFSFLAADGNHTAVIQPGNPSLIKLSMSDVVTVEDRGNKIYLDTGSPHVVTWQIIPDNDTILEPARKIRYHDDFRKSGVNVNFAGVKENHLVVRTYERGVEDETLSCGTGVTATALAAAWSGKIPPNQGEVEVFTRGGKLKVYFTQHGKGFSGIWLEGPVEEVFRGVIDVR